MATLNESQPVHSLESAVTVDAKKAASAHPLPALMPALNALWPNAKQGDIACQRMSGAMTNLVFRCDYVACGEGHRQSTVQPPVDAVIVRVDALPSYDKAMELECFKTASRVGIGARLLVKFNNGRLEECFKEHRPMATMDMADPLASSEIAASLACFHVLMADAMRVQAPLHGMPVCEQKSADGWGIWDRMLHWAEQIDHQQQQQQQQQQQCAGQGTEVSQGLAVKVQQLLQQLEAFDPLWVTYGHNDLQCGNILVPCAPTSPHAHGSSPACTSTAQHADPTTSPPPHHTSSQHGAAAHTALPSSAHTPTAHITLAPPSSERPCTEQSSEQPSTEQQNSALRPTHPKESSAASVGEHAGMQHPQGATHELSAGAMEACRKCQVKLIDYDYACWSTAGFDIANHWCEWAATYHLDNSFTLDYARGFPNPAQQHNFVASYLHHFLHLSGIPVVTSTPQASLPTPASPEPVCVTSTAPTQPEQQDSKAAGGGAGRTGGDDGVSTGTGAATTTGATSSRAGSEPATFEQWVLKCLGRQAGGCLGRTEPEGKLQGSQGVHQQAREGHATTEPLTALTAGQVDLLVHKLCAATRVWAAASHLHWGLWGLAQQSSSIEFDYVSFAHQRLSQYACIAEHLR